MIAQAARSVTRTAQLAAGRPRWPLGAGSWQLAARAGRWCWPLAVFPGRIGAAACERETRL